jgi:hypothetical protein
MKIYNETIKEQRSLYNKQYYQEHKEFLSKNKMHEIERTGQNDINISLNTKRSTKINLENI